MNRSRTQIKPWLKDWRVLALIIGFLVVVTLLGGRPALERVLFGEPDPNPAANQPDGDSVRAETGIERKSLARDRFETPAGLIYNQNRLEHVMRHAQDDPGRDQRHGVFDANTEDGVLALLDEAFNKVNRGSKDVQTRREDGRLVHTIFMNRRIGYEGGRVGKQRGNQECHHVRLVVADRNVITAYPLRGR